MRRLGPGAFALLVSVACSGERSRAPVPTPPLPPTATTALPDTTPLTTSPDSIEATELAGIRGAEGRVSRASGELHIQLLNGHTAIFKDDTTLGGDTVELEHFSLPRYAGYLKAIHSHVIHEIPYEGNGGYLIVDDSTGDSTAVAGMPVLSPDGTRFVTTSMAGAAEFDSGVIEIWRMVGRKPKKEFSYSTEHESWGASKAVWQDSVTIGFIKKLDRDARESYVGRGLLTRSGTTWVLTGSTR